MDTSLISLDVQPNYVRVTLKGKSLQIAFGEEVKPDSSTAKRSQTTGHLVITMPKQNPVIRNKIDLDKIKDEKKCNIKKNEFLEVKEAPKSKIELLANIVNENGKKSTLLNRNDKKVVRERENSADFVDDCSVPPLE